MSTERVKLTIKGLQEDKDNGLGNKEMAEKYNLPATDIAKALKMAGIKARAKKKSNFELYDDNGILVTGEPKTTTETTENTTETTNSVEYNGVNDGSQVTYENNNTEAVNSNY